MECILTSYCFIVREGRVQSKRYFYDYQIVNNVNEYKWGFSPEKVDFSYLYCDGVAIRHIKIDK